MKKPTHDELTLDEITDIALMEFLVGNCLLQRAEENEVGLKGQQLLTVALET